VARRLTVLGTGYLGATHAACLAELGFEVLGLDTDPVRIDRLAAGKLPFFEPGLEDLLQAGLDRGLLRFTTSYAEVAAFADTHFVCVGTPQRSDGNAADLSQLRAAAVLREIYARQLADGTPFLITDFATAELVKVAANAFLATKISFINAMAEVCEATGADVTMLSAALSYDGRIGGSYLSPGLGFGGGCLPKDIRAFMARADELGVDQALSFLREVDAINMRRRARMVDLARELAGGAFEGRVVGVLGAAFKPNSDDIRDSPALDVAKTIHGLGARVTVYDPAAVENARQAHPELEYAATALDAARDAHIVLLLTEWPEFTDADPEILGKVVAKRNIVDGRGALDPERWRAASWHYRALGRP